MGSNSKRSNEIDLDLRLKYSSYVPKTIACLFTELEKIDNVDLRLAYLSDYLERYKEELSKVNTTKRQLSETIEPMKENIIRTKINEGQDMHDRVRVEEYFRWIKNIYENELKNIISSSTSSPSSFSSILGHRMTDKLCKRKDIEDRCEEKSEHHSLKYEYNIPINRADELDRQISKHRKIINNELSPRTSLIKELSEEINADPFGVGRSRRTWTPQLHRLFLLAVEKLGGPYDSSPKQIKECMQIEGLTNDHIKSHLQKYRIHQKISKQTIKKVNNDQKKINSSDLPDQEDPSYYHMFHGNQHQESHQQIPNLNSFSDEEAYIPKPPINRYNNFEYVNMAWANQLRNGEF